MNNLIPGELYKFNRQEVDRHAKNPVLLGKPNIFSNEFVKVGFDDLMLYLGEEFHQYSKSKTDVDRLLVFFYDNKKFYASKTRISFFERVVL